MLQQSVASQPFVQHMGACLLQYEITTFRAQTSVISSFDFLFLWFYRVAKSGHECCECVTQTITTEGIMRIGIPLLADRVAPRCTFADSVLVVMVKGRRIRGESEVPLNGNTWADLVGALSDQGVDTLICGGIAPTTRESIRSRDMKVIENVAGTR